MKKHLLILALIICCLQGSHSHAQDTVVLTKNGRWDTIFDMRKFVRFYEDMSGELSPHDVSSKPFFSDSNYIARLQKFKGQNFVLWNRLVLHNPLSDQQRVQLTFFKWSFLQLYIKKGDSMVQVKDTYQLLSFQKELVRRSIVLTIPQGRRPRYGLEWKDPILILRKSIPW